MKKYIHESNLIEGIDDPKEDEQSMVAWDYLKDQKELSHKVICQVHKLITLNQLAGGFKGYYRDMTQTNVRVGNRICPEYRWVKGMMDEWLEESWDSPIQAHVAFEMIHPFVDGNGRTGRMLMWWQEIREGKKPTLFLNSEKHEKYYTLFEEIEK